MSDESARVVSERGGLQGVQAPLHFDLALQLQPVDSLPCGSSSGDWSVDARDRGVASAVCGSVRAGPDQPVLTGLDWPAPEQRVCYVCGQSFFLEWTVFGDGQLELGQRLMCEQCGVFLMTRHFDELVSFTPEHNIIHDAPQWPEHMIERYDWSDSDDDIDMFA